jgi:hypothetical protein
MTGRRIPLGVGVASAAFLMAAPLPHPVFAADTGAALSAIADTADRICGIVATQGEASGSKIGGDVHAELSGLAKRLATLGVAATGDITSSKYQGVLQQDLPSTLKDTRECKLQVLDKLRATILPAGLGQQPGPGAPNANLLQSPSSASLIDNTKSPTSREDYGLYSCGTSQTSITCYVVISRSAAGQEDYQVSNIVRQTKLVDNLHVEHRLRRAYFIDGAGGHDETTNLSTGESVWLALEFEPGPRLASSGRIVLTSYGTCQLRGPIS